MHCRSHGHLPLPYVQHLTVPMRRRVAGRSRRRRRPTGRSSKFSRHAPCILRCDRRISQREPAKTQSRIPLPKLTKPKPIATVWLSVRQGPSGPRAVNRSAIAATPPTMRPKTIFSISLSSFTFSHFSRILALEKKGDPGREAVTGVTIRILQWEPHADLPRPLQHGDRQ